MQSQHDNFCWAPFREALINVTGNLLPCCEFKLPAPSYSSKYKADNFELFWNIEQQDLRQQMANGVVNPGCTYCLSSVKKMKDQINQKYIGQDPNDIKLEVLEINFANYCNLKCIMCNPYASSSINEEVFKHKALYNAYGFFPDNKPTFRWWDKPGVFEKLLEIVAHLKVLKFAGGEPMMVPETLEILKAANPNINLSFVSNGTKFSEPIWQVMQKFELIIPTISLEGYMEHNDYLRFNSKWSIIEDTLMRLKTFERRTKINIHHVLQHTSIYALPNLIKFCKKHDFNLEFNEVYNPDGYLTINSCSPADVKIFKDVITKLDYPLINAWLDKYEFDINLHRRFQQYITVLDKIRGTNYCELFKPNWR